MQHFLKKLYEEFLTCLDYVGGFWLLAELTDKAGYGILQALLSQYSYVVFAIIGIFLIYRIIKILIPVKSFTYKFPHKNVSIHLEVKDILSISKGAIVIPFNNQFKIFERHAKSKGFSLVNYLIDKEFAGDAQGLRNAIAEKLTSPKTHPTYPFGAAIAIQTANRDYVLVSSTKIDEDEYSYSNTEILKSTLSHIWHSISKTHKTHLVLPLIGTGQGGVPETREKVLAMIVNSFIDYVSEAKHLPIKSITICIKPEDVKDYNIPIYEIDEWLSAKVKFSQLEKG